MKVFLNLIKITHFQHLGQQSMLCTKTNH